MTSDLYSFVKLWNEVSYLQNTLCYWH